jgi:hypothetical protein
MSTTLQSLTKRQRAACAMLADRHGMATTEVLPWPTRANRRDKAAKAASRRAALRQLRGED